MPFSKDGNSSCSDLFKAKPQVHVQCDKVRFPPALWQNCVPSITYTLVLRYSESASGVFYFCARHSADAGRQMYWTAAARIQTFNSQKPKLPNFVKNRLLASLQKSNTNRELICRYIKKLIPKLHKQQGKLSMFPSVTMSLLPKERNYFGPHIIIHYRHGVTQ